MGYGRWALAREGNSAAPPSSLPFWPQTADLLAFLHHFLALFAPYPLDSTVSSTPTEPAVPPDAPDFEKSLAELEQIVERLERGELSLDESLQQFERGVQLTKSCQTALKQAEHKVELLLRKTSNSDDRATAPFDMDDDTSR